MSAPLDAFEQSLTFTLAGERYSLPAGDVVEVIRPRGWTRVPTAPPSLLGVSNFRGVALPVVSLRRLSGHPDEALTPASRVIVVERGQLVGLLVDSIVTLARAEHARHVDIKMLLAKEFGASSRRPVANRASATAAAASAAVPVQSRLQLLSFAVAGQEFALPIDDVDAIAKLPAGITAIPGADGAMLGVLELRDALVPLVSLRALLGFGHKALEAETARVIVTRLGNSPVGLVSDDVRAVLSVPTDAVDAVPPVLTRGAGEAQIQSICRLGEGRLLSVLSRDRLFDADTSARISREASSGEQAMADASSLQAATVEKFLVFQLGDETYGIPLTAVDRIVQRPERISRVPRAPAFVQGVMNIEGKAVPIIDQALRFSVPVREAVTNRKVIVITIEGRQTGFVVDKVSEIVAVSQDELKSAPVYDEDKPLVIDRIAILEQTGRVIMLVDPKSLLDAAERDLVAKLAAEDAEAPA